MPIKRVERFLLTTLGTSFHISKCSSYTTSGYGDGRFICNGLTPTVRRQPGRGPDHRERGVGDSLLVVVLLVKSKHVQRAGGALEEDEVHVTADIVDLLALCFDFERSRSVGLGE